MVRNTAELCVLNRNAGGPLHVRDGSISRKWANALPPLFAPDSSHLASAVFGLTGESKRNLINLLKYSSWQEALVNELLSYVFSPLREGEISLYRGSGNGLAPILLVAAEETALGCVERLEHEYALKAELDADWAARPVALTHYNDRRTLGVDDPAG